MTISTFGWQRKLIQPHLVYIRMEQGVFHQLWSLNHKLLSNRKWLLTFIILKVAMTIKILICIISTIIKRFRTIWAVMNAKHLILCCNLNIFHKLQCNTILKNQTLVRMEVQELLASCRTSKTNNYCCCTLLSICCSWPDLLIYPSGHWAESRKHPGQAIADIYMYTQ